MTKEELQKDYEEKKAKYEEALLAVSRTKSFKVEIANAASILDETYAEYVESARALRAAENNTSE